MLPNGIQYKRALMEQVIGEDMVDGIFEFCQALNQLDLTLKETALLFPLTFSSHGKRFTNRTKD